MLLSRGYTEESCAHPLGSEPTADSESRCFSSPAQCPSVKRLGLGHGPVQLAPPDFLQEVISDLLPTLNSFWGKVVKNMDPGCRSSGFKACLCLCDPEHVI